MQMFRATRDFSMSGVRLKAGDLVGFDGKSVIVIDGKTFQSPVLRGAVKAGWMEPVVVAEPNPKPIRLI
jgi:hypothetical protein